jgi:D-3-phosphoglycerate dehydrogenase
MIKVLLATEKPFASVAVKGIKKILEDAGFELVMLEKYTDHNDLIKAVQDVNALIIRSDNVNRQVIEAAKNLKVVVRAGAGYDNIDTVAATENKIVAMNTPGQNSNAVAELAIGMMIYYIRKGFSGSAGTELMGKTLGIHSYGNIGKHVARIAKGFGMKVYAYSPSKPRKVIEDDGINYIGNLEELYSTCQFISVSIPANAKTIKSINYELLSKMTEGATLINTARKEVIDEDGLLKMFAERKDFGYLSDIAPDCKSKIEEEFAGRFFFTPKKMGAQTAEANINAGLAAATQIVNFILHGDDTFKVN